MNNQRGFVGIPVLLLVIAVAGGVGYYVVSQKGNRPPTPTTSVNDNLYKPQNEVNKPPITSQKQEENTTSSNQPQSTQTITPKQTSTPKTVSPTVPNPTSVSQSGNKKITSCSSITEAGSYTMDKDLNVTGNGCLDIKNVNDVIVDCGGHAIILDQQNKPNNEAIKPLLGFNNVKRFSVTSCNFKVVNPSPVPSTVVIENSSDGFILNSTFYDPTVTSNGLDVFSIILDRTTRVKFSGNIVYGIYQQHYSNNNTIENNTFSPTLKTLKQILVPVGMDHGSHNIVRNNIIDGKWNGSDPSLQFGADDGIEFADESYDTIQQNKIKNNWDCGIETDGLIQNSTISGNTIINSGICGIGAWYNNSWKGNIIANNIIDSSPKIFYFFRLYALRPSESAVYFTDNIFRGNSFLNPTQDVSAVFSFHASGGGEKGGIDNTPYIASNNQFVNNNFNSKLRAPFFNPPSMAIDGGGNICGTIAGGDYPNIADFPLKCTSQ
ncbi:MAG: right-handed parallel beta-helix repeat-containing protein [Patescibacteria group bacterium]